MLLRDSDILSDISSGYGIVLNESDCIRFYGLEYDISLSGIPSVYFEDLLDYEVLGYVKKDWDIDLGKLSFTFAFRFVFYLESIDFRRTYWYRLLDMYRIGDRYRIQYYLMKFCYSLLSDDGKLYDVSIYDSVYKERLRQIIDKGFSVNSISFYDDFWVDLYNGLYRYLELNERNDVYVLSYPASVTNWDFLHKRYVLGYDFPSGSRSKRKRNSWLMAHYLYYSMNYTFEYDYGFESILHRMRSDDSDYDKLKYACFYYLYLYILDNYEEISSRLVFGLSCPDGDIRNGRFDYYVEFLSLEDEVYYWNLVRDYRFLIMDRNIEK